MTNWTIAVTFNIVGAVIIAAFGTFVLSVRPRTRRSILVGLYGVVFGLATGVFNLGSAIWDLDPWPPVVGWVATAGIALFLVVVLAMWTSLPSRRPPARRFILPAIMIALSAASNIAILTEPSTYFGSGGLGSRMYAFAVSFACAAACGLALILAQGLARQDATRNEWRNDAVLAAALMLWPGSILRFALSSDVALARFSWVIAGYAVLVAGAWLWAGQQAGHPRTARAVAWTVLAAAFLGLLDSVPGAGYASGIGTNGIARIVAVALLSYAIVRHHVLGLDVKVRFAIKTSTIAAVFLAVLFIVANIAQNYLGGQYGVVVGGAAAGLLFFAMAPIQRAAERLAEKAVPVAGVTTLAAVTPVPKGLSGTPDARGEGSYRNAVQRALRDGRMSREEETYLVQLAHDLGITGPRAHAILVEAEREGGLRGGTRAA